MGMGTPAKGPGSTTPLTRASARACASARTSSSLRQMTALSAGFSLSTCPRHSSSTLDRADGGYAQAEAISTAEAKVPMALCPTRCRAAVLRKAGPERSGPQEVDDVVHVAQVVAKGVGTKGTEFVEVRAAGGHQEAAAHAGGPGAGQVLG